MFIPFDRRLDWRNPPVLTLLLILINVAVYVGWQRSDDLYEQQAYGYYFNSQLPSTEFPRYVDYVRAHGDAHRARVLAQALDSKTEDGRAEIFNAMRADGPFLAKLDAEQVVTPQDPNYDEWRRERGYFESVQARSIAYSYGQKPYAWSVTTLITHMFLHAGIEHLVGNMIFLFIFGFVVEIAIGRPLFIFAYLLAGLISGSLDIAFRPESMIPGVGASGAISGLVGMYTVLFGLRKIWFFFHLLFYFDYVRAPAIVLLPLWLGHEAYYQLYDPSHVNRIAHIGGLIGGAAIAWLAKRYSPTVNHEYIAASDKVEQQRKAYEQGMQYLAGMDLDKARRVFQSLVKQDPDDRGALIQLYNIAKFNPEGDEYHRLTHRVLNLPGNDTATLKLAHETYNQYVSSAKGGPRFSPEQLMSLALRFAAGGYVDDAEKMIVHIVQKKPDFSRNPEALMALANAFRRHQKPELYRKYLAALVKYFPNSDEARHAQQVNLDRDAARKANTAAQPAAPPSADTGLILTSSQER